jgi:hypothetical protein
MFAMGGPQLGDLEAGIVANLLGAPFAVISGGIGCVIAVALMWRFAHPLRDYDGSHLREPELQSVAATAAAD